MSPKQATAVDVRVEEALAGLAVQDAAVECLQDHPLKHISVTEVAAAAFFCKAGELSIPVLGRQTRRCRTREFREKIHA